MSLSVLHLDTESTWRGGENQLRLLVEHAPAKDWKWFLAAPPESEVLRRLSSSTCTLPTPMRGLSLLSAARKLALVIRREGIQLIDCQSSRAHNLGLLIKLLVPECKLVVHRRVDYPPGQGWIHRKKYTSPLVDAYVCISAAIAKVLVDYGIEQNRLHVVRSAVDAAPFKGLDRITWQAHWRKEWELAEETPIIGNVAYLTDQKDHATLIAALGLLKQRGLRFFCFIAGDGPHAIALAEQARTLGLSPKELRFLGVRKDIPHLLAGADIFALSSRDEGLGTSLLDATHSGCALVATAAGGIPEIVEEGQTGLLAPIEQPEAFAAQLARVLTDQDLRAKLVRGAQARALEQFSLEAMVSGNLTLYRNLIDAR